MSRTMDVAVRIPEATEAETEREYLMSHTFEYPEFYPLNDESGFIQKEEENSGEKGLCDLCNETGMVGGRAAHIAKYHAVFVRWCRNVVNKESHEVRLATLPPERIDALGAFIVQSVRSLDKGPRAFEVIQRATEQIGSIISHFENGTQVYLFGSCVSSGSWDGVGDADFTALHRERLERGEWLPKRESDVPPRIAAALRNAGFLFEEVHPIRFTRVPVVKREQKHRQPLPILKVSSNTNAERGKKESNRNAKEASAEAEASASAEAEAEARIASEEDAKRDYQILYTFSNHASFMDIKKWGEWLEKQGARVVIDEGKQRTLTAHFHSAVKALTVFCQRVNLGEPTKEWRRGCPLPDIFFLDFDISCRPFGVRNSWYLRKYLSQRPEIRAGNAFVKQWSKKSGINNSSKGYLTSYAVTVLWVHYLLRTGEVKFVHPVSVPIVPRNDQLIVPYLPLLSDKKDDVDDGMAISTPIGRLLAGFFRYYVEFPWDKFVVSLRTEVEPKPREDLAWVEENEVMSPLLRERVWYRICIEDPYEENLNLGRHLSPEKADFVRAQFVRALWAVLHGQPERLLLDERALAAERLRTLLFRILIGRGTEGMHEAEAREELLEQAGEEVLGLYELERKRLTMVCEKSARIVYDRMVDHITLSPDVKAVPTGKRRRGRDQKRDRRRGDKKDSGNAPQDKTQEADETTSIHTEKDEENAKVDRGDDEHDDGRDTKDGEDDKIDKEVKDTNIEEDATDVKGGADDNIEKDEKTVEHIDDDDKDDKGAEKSDDDAKDENEDEKGEPPLCESFSLEAIDANVRTAGGMGFPLEELPPGARDAYFIARDRAFLDVNTMQTFLQHVEAVDRVLASHRMSRQEAVEAVRREIPTGKHVDTLIDALFTDNGEFVVPTMTSASTFTQEEPVLRRKEPSTRSRRRHVDPVPQLYPTGNPTYGSCSACGNLSLVQATSNPSMDHGQYCGDCWQAYLN